MEALLLFLFSAIPPRPAPEHHIATFSIVAVDTLTGDVGGAVSSKFPAVGVDVLWAEAGVGAVATQALANVSYGPRGLELMAAGLPPEDVIARLTAADDRGADRQTGMVDASGRSATYTGSTCFAWAGGMNGPGFACQGNILTGEETVRAMADAFQRTRGSLAERLVTALEAGQAAGGDRRGRQSAAVKVAREHGGYGGYTDHYVDLRVDDHVDPVRELRRLWEMHKFYFPESPPDSLIAIDVALAREMQQMLSELGYYEGPVDGVWSAAAAKSLEDYQGWENLEMRYRSEARIDPLVLEYLRKQAAEKKR